MVLMSARLVLRGREYQVAHAQTIRAAIKEAGLQPELYLAVRDGELVTDDHMLREGETIKLVAVVSGGAS